MHISSKNSRNTFAKIQVTAEIIGGINAESYLKILHVVVRRATSTWLQLPGNGLWAHRAPELFPPNHGPGSPGSGHLHSP